MFTPQHKWFPLVAPAVEVVTKAARASETPQPLQTSSGSRTAAEMAS
jgi:hypothetical protein